ncbi:hypothetical protein [Stenotrophomonas sp. NLF4-10]|uniref:hypothetical protein n=1 Tax=Stenotrophomonas sp. NLF4-10 TaxID=2918754 RepID=UPI001EFB6737|nr:hypothetical protein [Stenotrophomonas sp. NLF4-10]MCG8275418.1 hypothetical protein [Stenotrophomonas sp. NLF4-10]
MAIIIEEKTNVTIRREVYAADIRIRANPVDQAAGSVSLELQTLEYHDDEFVRMDPAGVVGELVGDFAARSFDVGGKEITGLEVVQLIKQYVADLHAEREAPAE